MKLYSEEKRDALDRLESGILFKRYTFFDDKLNLTEQAMLALQ